MEEGGDVMDPALLLEQLKMKAHLEQVPQWVVDGMDKLYEETYRVAYRAGKDDAKWEYLDREAEEDDEA